ncbi:MAG: MFS transporter, partial [Gammaproteobacteria bacterium]|nr:MFS transporter [Gammaproteobacteria bacterium]
MQNKNHLKLIFTVFLPLASGFFLTSIFRTINAVQAPALTHSLSLSTIGLGILSAAYFLSYGLFQIPLGILLDRFGARKIQTVLLCLAGFAIILFAAATNITELVISRLLVGIGVAAGLTAGFKANAAWFPKPKLAVVNSLMMALGGLGALTATAPAQFLITHIGWRQMNLWFAAIIFLLAAIIFFVVPELPQAQNNTKP